jgi:hypothetical protein
MIKGKSISKNTLISLMIIVVLAFGLSQGVQEAAPGQPITGHIILGQGNDDGHRIEITAPNELSGWKLEPGIINEQQGILHVKAKGDWQIKVSADKATNGYMAEYILAQGAHAEHGRKLKKSMKVKAVGYNEVDLKDGGVLITYKDDSQGNKWQSFDIPIIFKQEVSWDDVALPQGHVYNIAIGFNPS